MLGLKPVINFEDGGLVKDSTTRNMKKTLSEVIDKFAKENLDPEVWELCVVVFDTDEKLVEFVKGKIEEKCQTSLIMLHPYPSMFVPILVQEPLVLEPHVKWENKNILKGTISLQYLFILPYFCVIISAKHLV